MPPQRERGGRERGVTPKGFQALERKMQALEEQMQREINNPIRDERKDEDRVEENAKVSVLNP